MKPAFKKVAIVGVGLLGGSLGLALKRRRLAKTVVGIGWRASTLRRAKRIGAVDGWTLDIAEGVDGADLVVFATRVGLIAELVRKARKHFSEGVLVTDVGSTKAEIVRSLEKNLPKAARFVGSHPIAGSERRGVEAASKNLFWGAVCAVTPTSRTDAAALKKIERLWRALGMRVVRLSPEKHDRALAFSSHLPHLAAAALVAALPKEAVPFAATGFRDTTRVAGGDPGIWVDVALSNRKALRKALAAYRGRLAALESALRKKDAGFLRRFLENAQSGRARIHF
jgi:prephenate dehydrogenase